MSRTKRDTASHGGACPSWVEKGNGWRTSGSGSPAAVVQHQIGDDLAALQIETSQIGKPLESAALEHCATLAGVVEAHHRGQEHALAAAEDTQGVVEQQHLGAQVPLAGGALQTFGGAVAEPRGAGDFRTALPRFEEGPRCVGEMPFFRGNLIKYVLGQRLVHEMAPGKWKSGVDALLPAACCQGVLGGVL